MLRSPKGLSEYLWEEHREKRSVGTLAKDRSLGGGIPYTKTASGAVLYDDVDADAWVESRRVKVTDTADARRKGVNHGTPKLSSAFVSDEQNGGKKCH